MKRLPILIVSFLLCSGLAGQPFDAETMAKMKAEKEAMAKQEMLQPTQKRVVKVSKEDILMQNGTITTCDANFYDTGGPSGNYQNNENLTLTLLPATSGAKIKVQFTQFNVENNYDFLKIYDGTSPSATLLANLTGATVPADPFIASNAQGALTFVFTSDNSVVRPGWAATVSCYTPSDNNLWAKALTTTSFGTVGIEKTFTVTVKNVGTNAVQATDYSVQIKDNADNLLASAQGVDLTSGAEANVNVIWTPTTEGTIHVKGFVDFAADQDLTDNETNIKSIQIYPSGTFIAEVGTAETFPPSRIPFDYFYKNSASQTIYTPDQLQISGGLITAVAYENNFATNLTEPKPVKIWIGETTQTSFSGTNDWIDPSTLTLVYDSHITTPQGRNTILIPLQTPYTYTGGNLVIYTYRVYENTYYSSSDRFYGTEFTGSNCTRRRSTDTQFDPINPGSGTSTVISWVPNTKLFFSTSGLGFIEGTVTSGGSPLQGVEIGILGTQATKFTDASGFYRFSYLTPNTYNLTFSKHGYHTVTISNVQVNADDTTVVNTALTAIQQFSVSGTIIASDTNLPLEGVVVQLEGYENYQVTTDANGVYSFPLVYGEGLNYTLRASKSGYQTHTNTIIVETANITYDITLNEIAYPPVNVTATITSEQNALITWYEPGTLLPVEFRYDSGIQVAQLGATNGTNNTVLGAVHRVNAQIHSVSWYLTSNGGPHNTVNVFIFALNNGQPTNTILFQQMGVANVDNQWNTLTLPTPIDAPNGFYVAVSYAGFIALGTCDPTTEWPLVPQTQCYSMNYTTGNFSYVESLTDPNLHKNFMIRAYGYNLSKLSYETFGFSKITSENPGLISISSTPVITSGPEYDAKGSNSKVFQYYSVYRLLQGEPQSNWTLMASNVTDTFYVDNTWSNLSHGLYQYAVISHYTNNVLSEPVLSNALPRAMEIPYTVNITTNSGDPATGAVVTLTNQDGNPDHVYTLTANQTGVTFPAVWRGIYNISITKSGFQPYSATNLDITTEGSSHTAELIEIIVEPYGLLVTQQGNNALFSWNNYLGSSDDFDNYENFITSNIGDYTLADVDGSPTYAIQGVTFPNQEYVGSYIIFNPSATNPPLTSANWQPHSGSKYIACFAATTPPNNDWLITPQITVVPGMQITFWAKSVTSQYGLERFKVGVSTTGTAPSNFTTFLTGASYVEAPVNWTQYTYSLNAFVGQSIYIGIQCVSNDAFVFMVDDLTIQVAKHEEKAFVGYTVYLDGNQVADGITQTNYTFQNVPAGNHVAGVKSVYTSGSSNIVTTNFTMIEPQFTVTFNVRNALNAAIPAATIQINNTTLITNASGVATINLGNGTYPFTVSKTGYNTFTDEVTVSGANVTVNVVMTDIQDVDVLTFSIYPNPADNSIRIIRGTTSPAVVEIFNNSGSMVKSVEMNDPSQAISIRDLSSGVYFIRLIENQTTSIQRFIKK